MKRVKLSDGAVVENVIDWYAISDGYMVRAKDAKGDTLLFHSAGEPQLLLSKQN